MINYYKLQGINPIQDQLWKCFKIKLEKKFKIKRNWKILKILKVKVNNKQIMKKSFKMINIRIFNKMMIK